VSTSRSSRSRRGLIRRSSSRSAWGYIDLEKFRYRVPLCRVYRWAVKTLQDRPTLLPTRTTTIRFLVTAGTGVAPDGIELRPILTFRCLGTPTQAKRIGGRGG
jgi:hypothetical protein